MAQISPICDDPAAPLAYFARTSESFSRQARKARKDQGSVSGRQKVEAKRRTTNNKRSTKLRPTA